MSELQSPAAANAAPAAPLPELEEGTCVILRPATDSAEPGAAPTALLYGRIQDLEHKGTPGAVIRYTLYKRPEEVPGGRKRHHGSKELLKTDTICKEFARNVVDTWTLNTLKQFVAKKNAEETTEADFVVRQIYRQEKGGDLAPEIKPFCLCKR